MSLARSRDSVRTSLALIGEVVAAIMEVRRRRGAATARHRRRARRARASPAHAPDRPSRPAPCGSSRRSRDRSGHSPSGRTRPDRPSSSLHRHAIARLTCSMVPSVPFFTPRPRSFRRNMTRSPGANCRSPRSRRLCTSSPSSPALAQPLARSVIECAHLVVGVGEDDPALVGCLPADRDPSARSDRRAPPRVSPRHGPCRARA